MIASFVQVSQVESAEKRAKLKASVGLGVHRILPKGLGGTERSGGSSWIELARNWVSLHGRLWQIQTLNTRCTQYHDRDDRRERNYVGHIRQ